MSLYHTFFGSLRLESCGYLYSFSLTISHVIQELAKKCREVARMQRQLDDVPTQSELIQ